MKSLAGLGAEPQVGLGGSPTYALMAKPFCKSSQGAKRYLTVDLPEARIDLKRVSDKTEDFVSYYKGRKP